MSKNKRTVPIQKNAEIFFCRLEWGIGESLIYNLAYGDYKALYVMARSATGLKGKLDYTMNEIATRIGISDKTLRPIMTRLKKKNLVQKHSGTYYINPMAFPNGLEMKVAIGAWEELFNTATIDLKGGDDEKSN